MLATRRRSALVRLAAPLIRPGTGTTDLIIVSVGTAVLVAGLAVGLHAPFVTALVVAPTTVYYSLRIVVPTLPQSARRCGPRRIHGARLLGTGVMFAGVATTAAGLTDRFAPDATIAGTSVSLLILLAGLVLSNCGYLLGLVSVPGAHLSPLDRIRRTLDGIAMGLCGLFVAWMLLFCGGVRVAGLTAVLMSCTAFCMMVVAGLRSAAGRPATLACGAGIALSIASLTQFVVALDYHDPANRVIASGVALLVGPVLICRAAQAVVSGVPALDPFEDDGDFGGYPLFAMPLVAALLAWGHHFVQRQEFDSTAVGLAVAAVMVVALRGALASIDARRYARRLAARESHFRSLFAGSTDVIMVLDSELRVRWQSPAAARQLGISDQDVVGRPLVWLVHPGDARRLTSALTMTVGRREQPPTEQHPSDRQPSDHQASERQASERQASERSQGGTLEVRLRDGFGVFRDIECKVVDHRSIPAVAALVVHLRDIGERKHLQQALRRAALTDQLTGLPNRGELRRALAERDRPGALIVLGLIGLAGVNDARGHGTGDAVLVEAARRVRHGIDNSDLPVRLDGFRLAVLTDAGAVQAQFLATRLTATLAEPYPLPGGPAHLSVSAGLAEVVTGVDGDEVLRRAELALRRGGSWDPIGAVNWYDESIETVLRRQLAIEHALPGLLDRGELELLYQPIVELATRRPVGVEAIPRWRHPELGIVAIDEFMPVSERVGLADEIGDWLLHRACRDLAGWLRDRYDVWLSVDVTVERLTDPAFMASVERALANNQVPAAHLVLELSEPGLSAPRSDSARHSAGVDPDADLRADAITERLTELRSMGVRVALDNFGTVSTSLSRLRVMPADLLKIDHQLFGRRSPTAGPSPAITDVVVRLGEQLGMLTVAQGLRDESDLSVARGTGCQLGQGEVFCAPAFAEHLEAYLDSRRSPLL